MASPPEQMRDLLNGYWVTQAIHVAARLGLADLVKDGARTAEELAPATGTDPAALYRLLRALASVGVFVEDGQRRFGLTPLAECLRSDLPWSQRWMAIMSGEEHYRAFGELLWSVRTGKPAFDRLFGMPIFEYLSKNPEQAKTFDRAMVGVHGHETQAMIDAFDLSGVRVLADVGGGNGSLLCAVLQRYPKLKGILFDLPGVIERARANVEAAGLTDRCQLVAGNFFESVCPGADAYLMRHIIHDWDDGRCRTILGNVHRAMSDGGRLLVVETVIPAGNDRSFGKLLDLAMLVLPGGKERTEEEYRRLFAEGGFRLTRIVPTRAEVSVVEGVRG